MSRLVSSVSLVFLALLLVLPLLMIDGLILSVGDVSYDSFVGCLVFSYVSISRVYLLASSSTERCVRSVAFLSALSRTYSLP